MGIVAIPSQALFYPSGGGLDGIGTGIRQLIRSQPQEIAIISLKGLTLTVPTEAEMFRIKTRMIARRNANMGLRQSHRFGRPSGRAATPRWPLNRPTPRIRKKNGQSTLQQLQAQR